MCGLSFVFQTIPGEALAKGEVKCVSWNSLFNYEKQRKDIVDKILALDGTSQ